MKRLTSLLSLLLMLLVLTKCSERQSLPAQERVDAGLDASSTLDSRPSKDRGSSRPERLGKQDTSQTDKRSLPESKEHSVESPPERRDSTTEGQKRCGKDFLACKPYPMRFLWSKKYIFQNGKNIQANHEVKDAFQTPQGFLFHEIYRSRNTITNRIFQIDRFVHFDIAQQKVLFDNNLRHNHLDIQIIVAAPYFIRLQQVSGPHNPTPLIQIFACRLSDGRTVWQDILSFKTKARYVQVSYSPKSQLLAVRNYNELLVYNIQGQLQWKHTFKYPISCNPIFDKDDNIYLCSEGYITSFTIKGKERWKTWGYERDLHPSLPAGTGSLSFGTDGLLYGGSALVSKDDPTVPGGGFIHTYTKGGKKVKRMIRSLYSTINGPVLTGPNNILYGIWGSKLHAYTADGKKRWDVDAQIYRGGRVHPTVLADGTLLAGDNRNVVLYNAQTGKEKWILPTNEVMGSPFVFVRDGKLYVVGARSKSLNKVGILEYHYPIAPLPKTGWPMINGGPEQHRRER